MKGCMQSLDNAVKKLQQYLKIYERKYAGIPDDCWAGATASGGGDLACGSVVDLAAGVLDVLNIDFDDVDP